MNNNFHLTMGNVISSDMKVFNETFNNNNVRHKVRTRIPPWADKNFLYWILVNGQNCNEVALVVQNIFIDDCPTFIFYGNCSNQEASLSECVRQFNEFIVSKEKIDLNKKNVIINRWWKKYLFSLPLSYDSYLKRNV